MQVKREEFDAMSISDILKKLDRLDELELAVIEYDELVSDLRSENVNLEEELQRLKCEMHENYTLKSSKHSNVNYD